VIRAVLMAFDNESGTTLFSASMARFPLRLDMALVNGANQDESSWMSRS